MKAQDEGSIKVWRMENFRMAPFDIEEVEQLSASESYGMAAAEAAAAGLPLLGLDTGELRSFGDEDARTILPIDATDDVVASALRQLLARPHALRAKRATRPGSRRTWRCAATEFAAACR